MASKTALKTREKGAGCVYHDGKRWYIKTRIGGKTKTAMLRNADGEPCTTKPEAERAADGYKKILLADNKEELAVHIAEAKKLKKQSGLRLADAWTTYLDQPNRPASGGTTLSQYRGMFQLFINWMNGEHPEIERVAEIDRETADGYFSAKWRSGISARTYNANLQALKMIFKHLVEPAALDENPFEHLMRKTNETTSRREFNPEQVKAIFDGFSTGFKYTEQIGGAEIERTYKPLYADEMNVLLHLCCYTGARGQDACLMEWRNISLGKGIVSYVPRKTARKTNHRAVTLPIHPALMAALQAALSWRRINKAGEDYIIPAVADRYRRNPTGVQKDVMKIIRCATGLKTTATDSENYGRRKLAANAYSLHSFRHTFVSFCANAGVPLAVVAEIVGHGNPAMTRHYSHISTESKLAAIESLPLIDAPAVADKSLDKRREQLKAFIDTATEAQLQRLEQAANPEALKLI